MLEVLSQSRLPAATTATAALATSALSATTDRATAATTDRATAAIAAAAGHAAAPLAITPHPTPHTSRWSLPVYY